MNAANVRAAAAAEGITESLLCEALTIALPALHRLNGQVPWWGRWASAMLVRALEDYVEDSCG